MKRCFIVLALFLCCFFSACSGATTSSTTISTPVSTPSTGGSTATTPTSNSNPTVLLVTRTDPSATNNIGPLNKSVTDVAIVQNLYTMAQKLPAYPVGSSISQSCLNDLGVIYHLDFRQDGSDVQRMNLDPGNCKILYLSQTDLRQASDAFLNLLKQALALNSLTAN